MKSVSRLSIATHPKKKLTIIGGGIIGAMEAYFAYLDAKKNNTHIRITILEKNFQISETTSFNIAPSLTHDEIFALPSGDELLKKSHILFSEPGGIRVDDVVGVNDSDSAKNFFAQVLVSSKDQENYALRKQTLLKMGLQSMGLWQQIYDEADAELKQILLESNFNPCKEVHTESELHTGYRVNLIHLPNAAVEAENARADYAELGYSHCKVLSPAEVVAIDPFLKDFCSANSTIVESGELIWNANTAATYLPGGCLNVEKFLPKFYEYLTKVMGKYINFARINKDCLRVKFARNVNGIIFDENSNNHRIVGLQVNNQSKFNKHNYASSDYVFCPGENVGTLTALGLDEPAFAGFAGASLKLNITIPVDQIQHYANLNNCMEVLFPEAGLAWQSKFIDGKIFIGVGGTKAFYGDKKPHNDEAFAKNKHLAQLNVVNAILPEIISLALKKDTKNRKLNAEDLVNLEQQGIAQRWVGRRALAFDGFPTIGRASVKEVQLQNARCTTHLSSGGVSFAPVAVLFSRAALCKPQEIQDQVVRNAIRFGIASRSVSKI